MAYTDERITLQKSLDLLQAKPQTKDEVQNLLYKLPELKLRPEKVPEEVGTIESWKGNRKYPYLNPVPVSMVHVDIHQLSKVDINWKMLTLDRPQTVLETQIFSRIVLLSKMTLRCIEREKHRAKGRVAVFSETEECFTYEYFSRCFASHERGQGIENAPKTPPQPLQKPDKPAVEKVEPTPTLFQNLKKRHRKKPKRKKKKKKKKKLRKKLQKRKSKSGLQKVRKTKKKPVLKKKLETGQTLMQMLKASENSEKKKLGKKTIEIRSKL